MTLVPFPEKVMLQTVSRCNAACQFCPYPHVSTELPQGKMDDALFGRIIDECAEHPGQVERLMLYLMNEPLLDPKIADRVNLAKQRNPQAGVHILTNGSLLTDRRADALIDSALDWIGISIHGYSPEAYQQAMGLKRDTTYQRVERFLEKAIKRRGPDWAMVTFNGGGPVTPDEREAEIAHWRGLGVTRISYFGLSISRAGNVPIIEAPQHETISGCNSIWWPEMLHVLFNGDVILCCMDWQRSVVVGNLREQTIEQLWHSDAYRRVRDTVAGRLPLPEGGGFPCSHCEEATVRPVSPSKSVDVALVVLPCAVMDSDGSTVPGVQSSLRVFGISETLADLSDEVYQRAEGDHTHLWHRAGHGIVHHGDGSQELLAAEPDHIEYCVVHSRQLPAEHLLFLLCRVNRAMTLEVVRRIKERDPGRSLLVYGSDGKPDPVLEQFGIPYHRYQRRDDAARWVAASIGRDLAPPAEVAAEESAPAPAPDAPEMAPPQQVKPPWRPPGWEGTGAGMVPPMPGENEPSALGRWVQSMQDMAGAASSFGRHPLLSIQQMRRRARESADALVGVATSLRGGEDQTQGPLSGVPGSVELACEEVPCAVALEPEPPAEEPVEVVEPPVEVEAGEGEGRGKGDDAVVVEPQLAGDRHHLEVGPPEPPPPLARPDSPWQNRPDQGRPVDVLLGSTPPWGANNPPVALAHLATYARKQGYGVEVLDMNLDLFLRMGEQWQLLWHVENKNFWSNEATFELLMDVLGPHLDEYAEIIAAHPAPLVGLSVVDPRERSTIELIKRVKQRAPDKRIILGGPACVTPEYRQIFVDNIPDLVDGYAMGEGEQILCDAIERVRAGRDLTEMPGVWVYQDGQEQPYKKRRRLEPLDQVPFPLYEDFLVERYPGDELIVEWSRGCIGSCTFCKGKMIDGKFRVHSAQAIFEGMRHYADWLGIRKFTICDPVLNGDDEVMAELCRLIVDHELELLWRGEAIPHPGLTLELAQAMRAAGCMELQLGLESGSDTVLEAMGKLRMFNTEGAAQVVRNCHEAGIRTALFIIIGFPGEGEAEFQETFEFVRDNAEYIDELKSINALHIITDTPIHMRAEKYKLCLPEVDYHYKWSTTDGDNTLEIRNDRIRRLMALAEERGIFVRETNLAEGKHRDLEQATQETEPDRAQLLAQLQQQVNAIRSV